MSTINIETIRRKLRRSKQEEKSVIVSAGDMLVTKVNIPDIPSHPRVIDLGHLGTFSHTPDGDVQYQSGPNVTSVEITRASSRGKGVE